MLIFCPIIDCNKKFCPPGVDAHFQQMARKQYARKIVAPQLLVINLICRSAVLDGIIRANPCADVRVPKGLNHTPRQLSAGEKLKIAKKGWELPGGLLPYFILYTGCRRGESLALTYKDIDHKRKKITINKSVCYGTSKAVIKQPKTKVGARGVI